MAKAPKLAKERRKAERAPKSAPVARSSPAQARDASDAALSDNADSPQDAAPTPSSPPPAAKMSPYGALSIENFAKP